MTSSEQSARLVTQQLLLLKRHQTPWRSQESPSTRNWDEARPKFERLTKPATGSRDRRSFADTVERLDPFAVSQLTRLFDNAGTAVTYSGAAGLPVRKQFNISGLTKPETADESLIKSSR